VIYAAPQQVDEAVRDTRVSDSTRQVKSQELSVTYIVKICILPMNISDFFAISHKGRHGLLSAVSVGFGGDEPPETAPIASF
jgi:hypothetical protein